MSSVKDELEELRRRSLAKNQAAKLQTANGLSTPEQEEEALKTTQTKTRKSAYQKEAVETLNAGSNAVDQDLALRVQQIAQKKEDKEKQKEASENLKAFNEAKVKVKVKTSSSNTNSNTKQNEEQPPAAPVTTVEDIPSLDSELEDIPQLEATDSTPSPVNLPVVPQAPPAARVPNRAEKKARKVMERLGMKEVPGIARVTLKLRGQGGFFTIFQPDVFEKSGSYIVFGEAKQGAGGLPPQLQEQQAAQAAAQQLATMSDEKKADELVQTPAGGADEEAVDETGVDAKDIDLVMSQVGCSRAKAVSALKSNDGDLVNAIMSLTS